MAVNIELTPHIYERFEYFLRLWQVKLNLQHWRIAISKQTLKKCMAMTDKFDNDQHSCRIRLGTSWHSEHPTDADIEKLAVHELLHILFHDLIEEAQVPGVSPEKVGSLEHHVINVLERVLLPHLEVWE